MDRRRFATPSGIQKPCRLVRSSGAMSQVSREPAALNVEVTPSEVKVCLRHMENSSAMEGLGP